MFLLLYSPSLILRQRKIGESRNTNMTLSRAKRFARPKKMPDWLNQISHAARSIRSTTQIWVVTRHQYGISALVSQTSSGGETSGSVAKCRLFSQAIQNSPLVTSPDALLLRCRRLVQVRSLNYVHATFSCNKCFSREI